MLKIRFNRIGRRNRPYYRIVVQEHTAAPGGRHVAIVGSYDPHAKKTIIKEEAVRYWLSVGAQASDTVHNLLVKNGVIHGKKRSKGKKNEDTEKEEVVDASEKDAVDESEKDESVDKEEDKEDKKESKVESENNTKEEKEKKEEKTEDTIIKSDKNTDK